MSILLEDLLQVFTFFGLVTICADVVGSVLQPHDCAIEDFWTVVGGEVDVSIWISFLYTLVIALDPSLSLTCLGRGSSPPDYSSMVNWMSWFWLLRCV